MVGERSITLLPSRNGVKPEPEIFPSESHQILVHAIADVSQGADYLTDLQKFDIRQRISEISSVGALCFLRCMKPYLGSVEENRRNALGRAIFRRIASIESALSPRGAEMIKETADHWMSDTFGIDRLERWGKETNGPSNNLNF